MKSTIEELGPTRVRMAIEVPWGDLDHAFGEVYKELGKQVRVMLRTEKEMAAVVRGNPFSDARGNNVQAFFLNNAPPKDLLETVRNKADDERIAAGKREVYVAYGEKGIGRSRLRIPAAEAGTARSMNTVARLAELAREME